MKYALMFLTHGPGYTVSATLDSFMERVVPEPTELLAVRDGDGALPPMVYDRPWDGYVLEPQSGFCSATRAAWRLAAESECDYVFWLEHDFLFERDVDLRDAASVLHLFRYLAQVSLMRQPVSSREKALGSVRATFGTSDPWEPFTEALPDRTVEWMRHRSYFTTNPSLMRTDFMKKNPWPDDGEECEGKYGLRLKEAGYAFGVMGKGETWVEHIGERNGFGY